MPQYHNREMKLITECDWCATEIEDEEDATCDEGRIFCDQKCEKYFYDDARD